MAGNYYSLEEAGSRFDRSRDFTIGIEEEFQLLDPDTLELIDRFEEMKKLGQKRLGTYIRGELIASEVEICTRLCDSMAEAEKDLKEKRAGIYRTAADLGIILGATGTHPFADWKNQRIIDTPHYRLVEEKLRYCAWRNTTFGMHIHIGIRGRERIIAIFNAMRGYLPLLLALSANSPFAEGRYTYLHSTRTQLFTKFFPRCNIPGPIDGWKDYADYMGTLFATGSISEPTQVWWSVRPHPVFGTLEIRVCDCQANVNDTLAITALAVAIAARLGAGYDSGEDLYVPSWIQVEENFWNAIRYGLDGDFIDFETGDVSPVTETILELVEDTSELGLSLGLDRYINRIPEMIQRGNGAQRQARMYRETGSISDVFREAVSWCQPDRYLDDREECS